MNPPPTTPPDPSPTRRIAPRRALPNGRAVVGALLVTTAAVGAYAVARAPQEPVGTAYVVLRHDIEAGERLTPDDVALESMLLSPTTASHALTSLAGLDDAIALTATRAGALLDARNLTHLPAVDGVAFPDRHELTIPVTADRTPSSLRRGDRVTLLAVSSHDRVLRTAVEDALVLSFEPTPSGIGSAGQSRLTLGLAEAHDVATVALLAHESLTVVLTTAAVDDEYPAEATVAPPTSTEVLVSASAGPEIRIEGS